MPRSTGPPAGLSAVRSANSRISLADRIASGRLPAWLAATVWSIMMTARTAVSSPASSSARSSAAVQAVSGSPRNTRYRARRRRSSARAGPGGTASMMPSSREQARAGSDASKRCSAARTVRRRWLSGSASGVRVTASSARSPAVSQAPRWAAIRAAASSSSATASSGPSAPSGQVAGPRLGAAHDGGQPTVGGAAIGCPGLFNDYRAHQRVNESDIVADIDQ